MPLYEYRCQSCGHQFAKIQSFSAPEEKECPVCQGQVERLLSAPAVQFKGSGWYVTDYASKGKGSSTKAAADGDSKATESKSADKAAPTASTGNSSSSSPSTSSSSSKSE